MTQLQLIPRASTSDRNRSRRCPSSVGSGTALSARAASSPPLHQLPCAHLGNGNGCGHDNGGDGGAGRNGSFSGVISSLSSSSNNAANTNQHLFDAFSDPSLTPAGFGATLPSALGRDDQVRSAGLAVQPPQASPSAVASVGPGNMAGRGAIPQQLFQQATSSSASAGPSFPFYNNKSILLLNASLPIRMVPE
ncbi:hypothetical protein CF326_g8632 [Tilletia indica]|uniref:Uncharacterized protein n=1 Tax=Tilletia indica TaxID=43049 RepID=A0A177T722_9BASI|nr:hypothetical protein CF326_g8632 [Tilletia indica]KAE8239733.1 hypothetical protein A4X13_0g8094 [Tilletia indica]